MRLLKSLLFIAALSGGFCFGQTADDLNEGLGISHNGSTGTLSWFGKSGRIYFILTTEDLLGDWEFVPVIETGNELPISWGFMPGANTKKAFFRLRYTDQFAFDALNEDFDGDSVTNMEELLQETNPFLAVDLDENGLADDWELFYSLSVAANDEEPDAYSNQIESLIGSDPNKAYASSSQMDVYCPN